MYRYTKEGNINELRHNSMYGYENKRNSLVYRYTRTAPEFEPDITRFSLSCFSASGETLFLFFLLTELEFLLTYFVLITMT